MSNFECTVTIADIYGAEWWSRNKEELDLEWEWGFGVVISPAIQVANPDMATVMPCGFHGIRKPLIALHRRKPKPPTLREVYGTDEVTIPVGWEWTGEWRVPEIGMSSLDTGKMRLVSTWDSTSGRLDAPRLILRERPKKVWFKCDAEPMYAKGGDWYAYNGKWNLVGHDAPTHKVFCATRHEEIDSTVQVVTQKDIDKCGR